MITIQESGMTFGKFNEEDIYKIEHSKGHLALGDGFKIIEFVYLGQKSVFFVEAKSKIPNSRNPESKDKYLEFWVKIIEKFQNSLPLYFAGCLNINDNVSKELPLKHKKVDWTIKDIQLILVIPTAPTKELPNLTDVFRQKIKSDVKMRPWGLTDNNIFVINREYACNKGLSLKYFEQFDKLKERNFQLNVGRKNYCLF